MSSEEHLHRGVVYVECHMDPNISKPTTDKKRVVASCAESESQSTSRDPNTTRFLTVQSTIRAKMQCDKKTLCAEVDASKKRNLMLVGGHADNDVDLCGVGNADAKRPYLGKGQTILTKYPHIQCFTCPTHVIDGFIKIICGSKEEIQMQRNEMGGVGVQHVSWDADLFEEAFAQA